MKIHHYIALALSCFFLSSVTATAGSTFQSRELNFDLFGAYVRPAGDDSLWGGGAALDLFLTRHLGVGVEGYMVDNPRIDRGFNRSGTVGSLNGKVTLRLPIDELRLAPYGLGGMGGLFGDGASAQGFLGGGLEFRVLSGVGAFGDARRVWLRNDDNYTMARFGIRLSF